MIADIGPLARELGELSTLTRQHAWCEDDQTCKIIPTSEYIRALTTAIIVAKENPILGLPVPGVDPQGFVWLTWRMGEGRGLALELRADKYRWTQNNLGDKRTFESTDLVDLMAAFRAVFPQQAILCP